MYSLIFLFVSSLATVFAQDRILIDDFTQGQIGKLPSEWNQRMSKDRDTYQLASDEEDQVLVAYSKASDNFIIKRISIDIVKHPYLNWDWKAMIFPSNGDESVKATCDVVASVNVVLRASRWKPKTIKYSWSTTLEEGTRTSSPFAIWPSRADIVVTQSGVEQKDTWITEKVNVLQDYLNFYSLDHVDSYIVEAIVIMSDSDNTKSESKAMYDNIYFSKQ